MHHVNITRLPVSNRGITIAVLCDARPNPWIFEDEHRTQKFSDFHKSKNMRGKKQTSCLAWINAGTDSYIPHHSLEYSAVHSNLKCAKNLNRKMASLELWHCQIAHLMLKTKV